MSRRAWAIALILSCLLHLVVAGALLASDNLISNGSFEAGDHCAPWVQESAEPYNLWQAAEGNWCVDLNCNAPGRIWQTVSTIPGRAYDIWFALAGNPDGGPELKTMTVQAAGQSGNFSFSITGKSKTNMGWTYHGLQFTAISDSTLVEFVSTTTDPERSYYGPVVDDISVIPEPTTLALLALAGSALLAKRRR